MKQLEQWYQHNIEEVWIVGIRETNWLWWTYDQMSNSAAAIGSNEEITCAGWLGKENGLIHCKLTECLHR